MNYLETCTKYFAPIDEIIEALDNNEGVAGISAAELVRVVSFNKGLEQDVRDFRAGLIGEL